MKGLNLIDKLVFFINSIVATMLLLAYLLPFVSPKNFAFLSVLSLAVPFLILLNLLFVVYWLLKVKKQLLVSAIVLGIGYNYVFSLYHFSSSKNVDDTENITVMSYNVRLFNVFKWIPDDSVQSQILDFITEKQPDILSLQEYRPEKVDLKGYFKYEAVSGHKIKSGQAIYSKFPIINSGSIAFKNTSNNAIFIDIVKAKDTLRIYNVHLQSLRINPNVEELASQSSENLAKRIGSTFRTQQLQAEQFLKHKNASPYKMIICGDFNNTAYSYVYKEIKGELQDTFVEAGNGFGRTFNFKFFPVRIDFVLVDPEFHVNGFKTHNIELSDHYPVIAKLKLH